MAVVFHDLIEDFKDNGYRLVQNGQALEVVQTKEGLDNMRFSAYFSDEESARLCNEIIEAVTNKKTTVYGTVFGTYDQVHQLKMAALDIGTRDGGKPFGLKAMLTLLVKWADRKDNLQTTLDYGRIVPDGFSEKDFHKNGRIEKLKETREFFDVIDGIINDWQYKDISPRILVRPQSLVGQCMLRMVGFTSQDLFSEAVKNSNLERNAQFLKMGKDSIFVPDPFHPIIFREDGEMIEVW
jgi:hypothetical protein